MQNKQEDYIVSNGGSLTCQERVVQAEIDQNNGRQITVDDVSPVFEMRQPGRLSSLGVTFSRNRGETTVCPCAQVSSCFFFVFCGVALPLLIFNTV